MKKSLVILQTTTPDYRAGVYAAIRAALGDDFLLLRGKRYFEPSVQSDERIPAKQVKNHYLFNRRLLFQTGIGSLFFTKSVLVLEMNPRILSNWMLLFFRSILGKETVLWGHAWPRKGKGSKSDALRQLMRRFASKIIVYTHLQRKELQEQMPHKTILAAPNALMSREKMAASATYNEVKHLIYVGRLTPAKKPYFLAEAFLACHAQLPSGTQLIFVGEGEERVRIEALIEKNNAHDLILLKGHQSDHHVLAQWYNTSLVSVSPGYVGLSATQSFGFGVPMLVSKDEPHAPEIEAIQPKENALFFETNNKAHFCEQLSSMFKNKDFWLEKRPDIVQFCKEQYSVEAMAQVFINLTATNDL